MIYSEKYREGKMKRMFDNILKEHEINNILAFLVLDYSKIKLYLLHNESVSI